MNMQTQDPKPTPEASAAARTQAWLDEAYAIGCQKRVLVKSPTLLERQSGHLEQVIGEVIMRTDRPGQWFDSHGNPVSDEVARQAGFPVERLKREGAKARRLAELKAQVEREFAEQAAQIEQELAQEQSPADGIR